MIVCIGLKEPADLRLYSEKLEVVGRHDTGADRLRLRSGYVEIKRGELECRNLAEGAAVPAKVLHLVVMDGVTITAEHRRRDEPKRHRILHLRPWVEQNRIGPSGCRGQGADAQRQSKPRRKRKARRHAQLA